MQSIAQILVYALFALAIALVAATVFMVFNLRRRFNRVWEEWGTPDRWLFLNQTTVGNSVFVFLQERGYLATGDQSFVRLCSIVRAGWFSLPILFLCATVALLWELVNAGRFS